MVERMGLLGRKLGMTQTYDDKGAWHALTVVEVGPCVVLDIMTQQRNGYSAVQIAFEEQKAHRVSRPVAGQFAKASTTPKRFIREIRLSPEELEQFQVGQTVSADQVFQAGDLIDVTGTSRGKGFQGVMKRYHFSGFRATHGTHEYFRHGGSIGCRLTPGRVYRGRKMPGQMGNRTVTVQNVRIHRVLPERNAVLIQGALPGAPGAVLTVRLGAKRHKGAFELIQAAPPAPEASAQAAPDAPAAEA